jgi:hypothetical protein
MTLTSYSSAPPTSEEQATTSPTAFLSRFSSRLRSLHYSISQAQAKRIHRLERQNAKLRSSNRELKAANKHLARVLKQQLSPDEVRHILNVREIPILTVRAEVLAAQEQLDHMEDALIALLNK